jgi:hypothetical protein
MIKSSSMANHINLKSKSDLSETFSISFITECCADEGRKDSEMLDFDSGGYMRRFDQSNENYQLNQNKQNSVA